MAMAAPPAPNQQHEQHCDQRARLCKQGELVRQNLLHARKPGRDRSVPAGNDNRSIGAAEVRSEECAPLDMFHPLVGTQSRSSSLFRSGSGSQGLIVRSASRTGCPTIFSTSPASLAFLSASSLVAKVRPNFSLSLKTA